LIALTSGDVRNAVWIGATRTQLTDASGHGPGGGGESHEAHYGGGWSRRAMDGSRVEAFPEGTTVSIGASGSIPTRHTLDGSGARQRTPYQASQRCTTPPAAFPVALAHSSGSSVTLTGAGAIAVTAAAGQTVTVSVSGGASVTIAANGNVSITSPAAINLTASGALTVQSTGPLNLKAPSIIAGNGGVSQFVRLANSANSTIFQAQ